MAAHAAHRLSDAVVGRPSDGVERHPFHFPGRTSQSRVFRRRSMRQLAPISPASHLGAEKILVIGAGRMSELRQRQSSRS